MPKVLVIYDTKHGNTKLAAETIVEGIKEVQGNEVSIGYVKGMDIGKVADYDAIIIGAPNHMGRPSQTMKKFVNRLAELDLKASGVAVFGTYSGKIRSPDRAAKKLEKMAEKKLPKLNTDCTKSINKSSWDTRSISGRRTAEMQSLFGRTISNQLMQKQ